MTNSLVHISLPVTNFSLAELNKGTWIVLLHSERIPPHAGMLFNGNYNSLTVKGHELDLPIEVIIKASEIKKIPSIFIKVLPHPVFSVDHQLAMFQENLKQLGIVSANVSCLQPLKNFFLEFYAVPFHTESLLFQYLESLNENNFLMHAQALNALLNDGIELAFYTVEELKSRIIKETQNS